MSLSNPAGSRPPDQISPLADGSVEQFSRSRIRHHPALRERHDFDRDAVAITLPRRADRFEVAQSYGGIDIDVAAHVRSAARYGKLDQRRDPRFRRS